MRLVSPSSDLMRTEALVSWFQSLDDDEAAKLALRLPDDRLALDFLLWLACSSAVKIGHFAGRSGYVPAWREATP